MTLPAPIGCPLSVESHCCTSMEKRSMIPFRSMTRRGAPWPRSIEFPFSHSLPRMRIRRRGSKREGSQRGGIQKGAEYYYLSSSLFIPPRSNPFPTRGASRILEINNPSSVATGLIPLLCGEEAGQFSSAIDARERVLTGEHFPARYSDRIIDRVMADATSELRISFSFSRGTMGIAKRTSRS